MVCIRRFTLMVAIFVVSAIWATSAHALVPKTFQYKVSNTYGDQAGWHFSASSACTAAGDVYRAMAPSQADAVTIFTSSGVCGLAHAGYEWGWPYADRISCPANSHESSFTCACDAGFEEGPDGLSCVKPKEDDACELLAGMCEGSKGMSTGFSLDGKKAGISFTCMSPVSVGNNNPLPGCNMGCMAAVGGFTTAYQNDTGSWVTTGTAKYVGSQCDPNVIADLNKETEPTYEPDEDPKTTDQPDSSCPNGFKGEVNGVSVCVPPKASSGVTELEEKDNGDGTKTNSKTEVKCENGKCEVTKSSTTTNNTTNNTVSSSSSTTTVDKAAYCAQNKAAGVCKDEQGNEEGKGKFGGSCSGGFTCEGDALQCAIAKEQHKRSCELHTNESPESKLYELAKGKTGKVTDDLPGNETIALTDRIDTSSALGAGYCPLRDINVDAFGYSKVLPLSNHCEQIGYVKIFFVGLSLLLGLWIMFGRK